MKSIQSPMDSLSLIEIHNGYKRPDVYPVVVANLMRNVIQYKQTNFGRIHELK